MSHADLHKFLAQIGSDSKLQDQLKGVTEKTAFTQALVKMGSASGFHFTADDVDVVLVQNKVNPLQNLSDADLAQVAGGRPRATADGCRSAWTTIFGPC